MPFFRGKKRKKRKREREREREREEITKMRKILMNIVLTPVNNLYAPAALDERVLNSYNLLKYCEINRCKRKSSMLLNKLTPTPPPSLSLSYSVYCKCHLNLQSIKNVHLIPPKMLTASGVQTRAYRRTKQK